MNRYSVLHAAILLSQQEICRMLSCMFGELEEYTNHPGESYNQFLCRSSDGRVWRNDRAKRDGKIITGYSLVRTRGWIDAVALRVLGRYLDFVEELPGGCARPNENPCHSQWAWVPEHLAPESNQKRTQHLLSRCEVLCQWQQALQMLIMHFDQFIVPMLAAMGADPDSYPAADEAIKFAWNEMQLMHVMTPSLIPDQEGLLSTFKTCFESCAIQSLRPTKRRASLVYVTQTQVQ